MNKLKITEMVKTIVSEATGNFGQFDVTDISQIIPKYKKKLQSFLTANRGGNLHGISLGTKHGTLMIIGDTTIVTIDMNTLRPVSTTLINK